MVRTVVSEVVGIALVTVVICGVVILVVGEVVN